MLIGKEFLFKVAVESKHIQGKDTVYVVERYSDNLELIQLHKRINHTIFDDSIQTCNDIVGDTNWEGEEDLESPSNDNFKTPEMDKNGKRVLDVSFKDGEESTTSKLKKT